MRQFLNGIVFTLALLIGAGFVAVLSGVLPSGADNKPPKIERWMANKSLHAAVARETKDITVPMLPTDENLLAGVKAYGQNCAVCHGASDGKASTLAKGFYIKAPQLASDGVEDDPEPVTYWKLEHGIRFTAMPAFGRHLSETQLWQLTLFLKHMDKLPSKVDAAWKNVPSVRSPS